MILHFNTTKSLELKSNLGAMSGKVMRLFKLSACLLTTGQMSLLGHQWRDLEREGSGYVADKEVCSVLTWTTFNLAGAD